MTMMMQPHPPMHPHPPKSSRPGFQRRRPESFISMRERPCRRRLNDAVRFNMEEDEVDTPLHVQVGEVLGWVAEANRHCVDQTDKNNTHATFLTGSAECPVPLAVYINNIMTEVPAARRGGVWVLIMVLVDRLCKTGKIECTPLTVHRMVLVALVLVMKQTQEYSFGLFYIGMAGGVGVLDLTTMEAAFLTLIDWDVIIRAEDYQSTLAKLPALRTAAREAAADALDSGFAGSPVPFGGRCAAVEVMPSSPIATHVGTIGSQYHTTTTEAASPWTFASPSTTPLRTPLLPLLSQRRMELRPNLS
eukprot:Hpha_TRINITY_DN15601_c3_g1::TRINITY_DN15601_c3_g1_i1::g.101097::m.101097